MNLLREADELANLPFGDPPMGLFDRSVP